MPAQLSSQLVLLAQQLGAELHHLLLAVFNVLLMRYSRQDDLTIGCAAQGFLDAVRIFCPLLFDPTSHESCLGRGPQHRAGSMKHTHIFSDSLCTYACLCHQEVHRSVSTRVRLSISHHTHFKILSYFIMRPASALVVLQNLMVQTVQWGSRCQQPLALYCGGCLTDVMLPTIGEVH